MTVGRMITTNLASYTSTHSKRKIRVVLPGEYRIYIDENGNTHAPDGRIINVYKEDIDAILEMADKSGGSI